MTNLNEQYKPRVTHVINALDALGCFKKTEYSVLAGEIEYNAEGEGFQVTDSIIVTALHNSQDDDDCPIVEMTIEAGSCIDGCPYSDDEYYLDEDGDFDEAKYMADVNDRLAELDDETECRENFIIRTVNFEGDFSYHVWYPYIWGGDGEQNINELSSYLSNPIFAQELADAVGDNDEEERDEKFLEELTRPGRQENVVTIDGEKWDAVFVDGIGTRYFEVL